MTETKGTAHNTLRHSGAAPLPVELPVLATSADGETTTTVDLHTAPSPVLYAIAVESHIRFLRQQLVASEAATSGALNPHVDISGALREELVLFEEMLQALQATTTDGATS